VSGEARELWLRYGRLIEALECISIEANVESETELFRAAPAATCAEAARCKTGISSSRSACPPPGLKNGWAGLGATGFSKRPRPRGGARHPGLEFAA
jgi:hypothetical protein